MCSSLVDLGVQGKPLLVVKDIDSDVVTFFHGFVVARVYFNAVCRRCRPSSRIS